jgi:hypothetical protein
MTVMQSDVTEGGPADVSRSDRLVSSLESRSRLLTASLWLAACALVLARSWQLGVDTNFDLLNYHLYKSTSLLDGSIFSDVAVAGSGTFLNPAIEIPVGVAIAIFGVHWGLLVGVAAIQLLCYLAVWRLVRAVADESGAGWWMVPTAFGLVITGSGAVSLSFTTFGDWVVAGLLCESMRALVLATRRDAGGRVFVGDLACGAWAGAAAGLKLTALPLVAGLFVAILVITGWRRCVTSLAGCTATFLLFAGPWMLYMQWRYGSPLFPLFNDVFHAGSAPTRNFDDARYGASTIRGIAEFPAEMFRGSTTYSEFAMQDWRFLLSLAVLGVCLVLDPVGVWRDRVLRMWLLTLAVSYILWVTMFGIYRYFLFGEVLTSVLIAMLIFRLIPDRRTAAAACAGVAIVGFGFQQAPNWGRDLSLTAPDLHNAVQALPEPPNLVLLSAGAPVSYLLEEFPSSTKSAALVPFNAGDIVYSAEAKHELDDLVAEAESEDSFYAISDAGATTLLPPLGSMGLADCMPFESNGRALQLCRVEPG